MTKNWNLCWSNRISLEIYREFIHKYQYFEKAAEETKRMELDGKTHQRIQKVKGTHNEYPLLSIL